ncbi:MAG: DUF4815 domain-containing protein [Candidatus Pelagibacter sp. TMED165]|nr:MAG: DUF4815 domain-containing protein [Candidatus Pelagibacter sp. TMED165]
MPSPTDFNLSPYYDDFSESKKFHRVLFRPAFAVQARELTQSQTLLQNQIERFGDHMFKHGAMVIPGSVGLDLEYYAVKLTSKSAASLTTYNGTTVTGGSSGVIAEVVGVEATDGTDPDTLYVKYNKTGTNNTAAVFTDGETITSSASGSPTAVVDTTATGSAANVKAGVYYINGFFVQNDDETLVLDKYTNTPSYRVGFTITESFISPSDDTSLNDNAAGSSNQNAPGAHRFKIALTLAKKTLSSTEDSTFVEVLRVENGNIKSMARATDYNILQDTLARRTFDESGDYALSNPEFDVREHLISGNNRGIFSSADGGLETKLAIGVSPFKAYVNGYEAEILSTTFVDVDKARDTDDANNNKTRFNVKNFVQVDNVFGTPDVSFVSGETEAFKNVNLYQDPTSARGTEVPTVGVSVTQIGRAKSRGFEYTTGTETLDIFATGTIFKHFLFDIEMFSHVDLQSNATFTTGEKVSGATSGATGVVMSDTAVRNTAVTSISASGTDMEGQFSAAVVTLANHGVKDGMQISLSGGNYQVDSVTISDETVYCAKNVTTNTFELYTADGTTAVNVTTFSSAPTLKHTTLVLSNVQGTFSAGETVTGDSSNASGTVQADRYGFKGFTPFDFEQTKQIGMAGSPTYTADTRLDSTYGANKELTGNASIANSTRALLGKGTLFTTELKVGDSITFTNDAGSTVIARIAFIESQTSATLTADVGSSDVTTAGVITRRRAKLNNPEQNISIFKLPYINVETLKTTANSGATDTNFNVRRQFVQTLSSNGDATITAGTNETFSSQADDDFSVSIMTTGSGGTGSAGDTLNTSGNNHEGDSIFTLGGSPSGKTLTLDFGANFAGHKVKIIATVSRTVAGSKTKTLNEDQTLNISSQSIIESGVIGLGKADIFEINKVYMSPAFGTTATSSHTDITSRFDLDNGQRDNFYDIGRIKLKPGALKPTGQLLIDFDFFAHGAGDYFDVDSYSGVVTYANIPSYTSETLGTKFELRDSLDFRPRVDDASTLPGATSGSDFERSYNGTGNSTIDIPEFNTDITTDFSFFLSRIDKIFITREAEIKVVKGASALNPLAPQNLDGHMHLATLEIPSYTLSTEDVQVIKQDNRRFTMRDIGRLEKRIQNVEYYTQLSLLEADAQSLQIQDANGFDRFKNGFIVDNFSGHNIGDVGNNDYKLSIDRARGEARPMFSEDIVELEEIDEDGTAILSADRTAANYQKTGTNSVISLPYTETNVIEQPYATKTENLNPFLIFDWIGNIELTPPLDEWKETLRAPDITVNLNGGFDNFLLSQGLTNTNIASFPLGTEWNEWQDQWTGNPRNVGFQRGNFRVTNTVQDVVQTRRGVRTEVVPQTVSQQLGDRVISVNFVPFIRARTISFTARGMRPNTRVFPFFDEQAVASFTTPDGGSLGGNLNTDTNGSVTGTFAIPDPTVDSNPRFRTGTRVFRLSSSSTNADLSSSNTATSAEADYIAKGLQETVRGASISTREPRIVRTARTETRRTDRVTRSVAVRNRDPLAQSFIIDETDGIFITSLDAFFATKSSTIPVRAEIREMSNGYPTKTILPFAQKYLNPGSVNTSTTGATSTTFTFESPVYLKEGTEYCFVLYSDSSDYTAYVSRLGGTQIGSDRKVSKQPAAGVLFKSANSSTWEPDQMEDLKFTLKKAVFDTSTSGTLTLANKDLPVRTLAANPLRTFNGTGIVRVFHKNHGMHSTSNNVTIAGVSSGTYNGIAHSDINGTYTSISNITLDSYDITTSGTATASGDVGGSSVTATENRAFDVLQLQVGTLNLPGTSLTSTLKTTTGKSIHGVETPFTIDTTASNTVLLDNIYFTEPRLVASAINETNEMSGSKSMIINLSMSTTNANLSPIIDLQRINAFAINNRLNNPVVSSTDTFTGDGSSTTFTLSSSPSSVHLLSIKKNGLKLQPVDDFTVSGTTLTMVTAPASGATLVAKLSNTIDFEEDTATEGGSSEGVYVTKSVNLENPSTALEVRVAASVRSTSSIKCFFRASGGEETRRIKDIEFTPFNTDGSPDTAVDPSVGDAVLDDDFKDHKFSASNLKEFTTFEIKIVFRGTISAYTPRLKDLRGIALAV